MANILNGNETLAREMRKPDMREFKGRPIFLLPDGFKAEIHEELLENPPRKKGVIRLHDTESFIKFVKQEGSLASCRIYIEADYQEGNIGFTAIINDHETEKPNWRDYRALYQPQQSVEWQRWISHAGKMLPQADFAQFLEGNNKDITSVEGMPTGAQVLAMALNFESKQEVIVKSAIRTQSGTVTFAYSDHEDANTIERMEMYKGFSLGLAPFFNGQGFRLDTRLKYKHMPNLGKVLFWYELDRPDLILEKATQAMIEKVKNDAGFPIFYGSPG
ncbi:MAG: hypothetical protein DMF06_15020 [Verrucomicrobia bacterium]|nr:MAG: hypothetical protein DMF06_15020 [Verrucomicrobiota bacterium]